MQNSPLALRELRAVAHTMRRSGLTQIEIGGSDYHVRLRFEPACDVSAAMSAGARTGEEGPQTEILRACLPGTVCLQYPGRDETFVSLGATVRQGALLALLKVGLAYLPVLSPADGTVTSMPVRQGYVVEYDSVILTLRKTEA
ncbi:MULTISPECIES: acetyl-CoA carboxylase biotin carboxyl carrier protein [Lonsdalea]|nr:MULTISPECIES: acetyl-CoA carboxylase biotin carboxyl carrier protein subunit [Lonsdalea]QPQ24234.1 acetyl-CoA carboxylase biotin carboxyl carrier protein subunit [Lonsdalea populi]